MNLILKLKLDVYVNIVFKENIVVFHFSSSVIGYDNSKYYQLSHGCQGDTEKYLTRGNLYHPRHNCITRDVVEGNTGVLRVIQIFEGQIISSYHPILKLRNQSPTVKIKSVSYIF